MLFHQQLLEQMSVHTAVQPLHTLHRRCITSSFKCTLDCVVEYVSNITHRPIQLTHFPMFFFLAWLKTHNWQTSMRPIKELGNERQKYHMAETVQTVIACCFHNYANKAHEDNLSRVLFFMLTNIPKSFLVLLQTLKMKTHTFQPYIKSQKYIASCERIMQYEVN